MRDGAFAAVVAKSLLGACAAQGVELRDVVDGKGGFVIHGGGSSVAGAGDVNGDGLADFLLGDPGASPGDRYRAGESHLVFGKATMEPVEISEIAVGRGGFAVRGEHARDYSGSAVSGAADVNVDGTPDLLVGANGAARSSYVVFGRPTTGVVELSEVAEGKGGFAIRGSGSSVSGTGDVNGDGLADLLLGDFATNQGHLVFGKLTTGAVELSDVATGRGGFTIQPVPPGIFYSAPSVSGAGDVDGDGLADLLLGNAGANGYDGESYVVFGKAGGEAVELANIANGAGGFVIQGNGATHRAGGRVAGAGDVNGDGTPDLLIGAWRESYVVFGKPTTEAVDLSEIAAGRNGFVIRGETEGGVPGFEVSGTGDIDGDGLADIIIAARVASDTFRAGESYVVFGKATTEPVELSEIAAGRSGFVVRGESADANQNTTVVGGGDVNGDGVPDFLIASGRTYVVFGPSRGIDERFRRGAVRGEETLEISDSIRLLGYLFTGDPEPPCLDAADADDSGELDISDAVRGLGYLFLGAPAPPAPGPTACGQDPTADELNCARAPNSCPR